MNTVFIKLHSLLTLAVLTVLGRDDTTRDDSDRGNISTEMLLLVLGGLALAAVIVAAVSDWGQGKIAEVLSY